MKLYDFLKEFGIPAKEAKTRLSNKQIEVNGVSQDGNFNLGNIDTVYDQGFFMRELSKLDNFNNHYNQLIIFGLSNLIGGGSNIKNSLTDFLSDYLMVKVSKETLVFIKLRKKNLIENQTSYSIEWDLEGRRSELRDFEIVQEVDNTEMIDKLKSDLDKVNKQLSNPGFMDKAPQFKIDGAIKRKDIILSKLTELGYIS